MNIATYNGKITVKNPKTGEHRTFQIKTVRKGKLEGKRIVSMLYGPDNCSDYRGFGFVDGLGFITLWKAAQTDFFQKVVKILEKPEAYNLEYLEEGRCIRCNRVLTHPDSITSGIGPECAKGF